MPLHERTMNEWKNYYFMTGMLSAFYKLQHKQVHENATTTTATTSNELKHNKLFIT